MVSRKRMDSRVLFVIEAFMVRFRCNRRRRCTPRPNDDQGLTFTEISACMSLGMCNVEQGEPMICTCLSIVPQLGLETSWLDPLVALAMGSMLGKLCVGCFGACFALTPGTVYSGCRDVQAFGF